MATTVAAATHARAVVRQQPAASSFRPAAVAPRLRSSSAVPEQQQRLRVVRVSAAQAQAAAAATEAKEEYYEVTLAKPLGVKFARGNDGGAYVVRSDPKLGNTDSRIEAGDKVVKVSASFGGDIWEALNFGQVIYAIKTRNGDVYMRLKRNFGDMSALQEEELTEAEKMFKKERGGGNYGAGTKEMQERNYIARKEAERERRQLFDDALAKFKKGEIETALIDFENVLSLEPKNYLGDDFSRVTQIYRVTQYNIACCYSMLDNADSGLEALNSALASGFEDYAKVRSDPNLANLRKSPKFKPLLDRYDEPIINEGAIKALKSLFSFGKKDD
ncbi:hypothetical protein ABPG77_007871 [Micractinium sp. CCAP 211/92]